MTRILNVLLDLSFLSTGRGIAELRLEHIVTGHRQEAHIDVSLLATAGLVDCRAHIVIDAAAGEPLINAGILTERHSQDQF